MLKTILLAALTLAESDPAAVKGRLCWVGASAECVATAGTTIEIAPAETARDYVWTSDDGGKVVVGRLDAKGKSIDLASKDLRVIGLSVTGSTDRGWPHETQFTVAAGKEERWKWSIAARQIVRLREIAVPPGEYGLTVSAPRHLVDRRRISPRQTIPPGSITLKPLPAVSGRLVEVDGEKRLPVIGAQILSGEGDVEGSSGPDGRFRVELKAPLPKELLIVHPRLATYVVDLEERETEKDLGELTMSAGVTLTLRIVQRGEERENVKVRLLREAQQKYELTTVSTHELPADQEELVIANVPKGGKYHVVVEGNDPLERVAQEIDIGDDAARATISIEPFTLRVSALLGDEPLKGGTIGLSSRVWRGDVKLDDAGKFSGVLWQPGKQRAFLRAEALGVLAIESPELGSDPSEWRIELKRRLIEGTIVDAETGQPLSGVSMGFQMHRGEGASLERFYSSVPVDASGRYVIAAIKEGAYDIEVKHADRVPQRRSVEITANDGSKRIDFALDRGVESPLEVVWSDGRPVAAASIVEGVSRDGHNPQRFFNTDGAGRVVLRSAPRELRTLWVMPREGSFAVVQLAAPASAGEARPMRVVVPLPTAALAVDMHDAKGEPPRGVVLLRYNGEWIPYPVVGRLKKETSPERGVRFLALPAGAYEVWAVAGGRDFPSAPPPIPPVRVGLATGEQRVKVPVWSATRP